MDASHPSESTRAESATGPLEPGWSLVPCPLCGESDHAVIMEADTQHYGTRAHVQLRQCRCGFMLTNPQPLGEALAKFYETDDYYTHAIATSFKTRLLHRYWRWQVGGWLRAVRLWAEQRGWREPFVRRVAPPDFRLQRGQRMLDFGCGNGQDLAVAAGIGLRVYGIEPDRAARQVAEQSGNPIFDSIESLRKQLEPDTKFDRIVMKHVLEHLPDPLATLRELGGLLDSKGRMLVLVPNIGAEQGRTFGIHWLGFDMPRHLWHFSPETLSRAVELAGLKVIHTTTIELPVCAALSNDARESAGVARVAYQYRSARASETRGQGTEVVAILSPR